MWTLEQPRRGDLCPAAKRPSGFLIIGGTAGLLRRPTEALPRGMDYLAWAAPRSPRQASWNTLSINTLIVPDKQLQPVCLETMFLTIPSLINWDSSRVVILGGSITLTNVGCSLLFRCMVAVRFCSASIG